MEDHGSAQHLLHRKPAGQRQGQPLPRRTEHRRQIPRVVRMGAAGGVEMPQCIRKWLRLRAGTGPALVNVQPEHRRITWAGSRRQSANRRQNQHPGAGLIELYRPGEVRMRLAAGQHRNRLGLAPQNPPQRNGAVGW